MDFGYDREDKLREQYSSSEYAGYACKNCGRQRVLLCANSKHICEKCYWDQNSEEYSSEYVR